ncbi:MEK1 protein kinase [Blastocystis sp. subtype 4]|uniref:MEK1 protein kinase n=1 Tax=Blastocystis sp. subtype 4 TaxID=944170 RepID=UPI000711E2B5|nr:MEK1 protein kinase [Blastocystis sp. subtype 4]KNB46614.1 MEK1 protein kinase [Blastocystis sp. subtype 4]|eukprot:XP_014530050.1 MEK1 protein kinase [Blastocystis sp. subtype 4]
MSRKLHPSLDLSSVDYRESYRFTDNRFVRGSKAIEVLSRRDTMIPICGSFGHLGVVRQKIMTTDKANRDQLIHEEEEGSVCIVLEYMDSGSLDHWYSRESPIPDRVLRCITWQLVCALSEIRKAGITHRDIKPSNILLHSNGSVKLSDFGISKRQSSCRTFVGTLRYMSPERLLSEDYTYKCDYWSMALVIMEAALGYYPIQSSVSHVDLATSITQYGFDTFFRTSQLNPELVAFLSDWLKEERLRMLPQLKIKDRYLRLDGKPITKEVSMQIVSDWLKSKKK